MKKVDAATTPSLKQEHKTFFDFVKIDTDGLHGLPLRLSEASQKSRDLLHGSSTLTPTNDFCKIIIDCA